jgi:hypothetical protein
VRVELRIGELVVDGVAMSGRDIVPFREAIEAELSGLVAGRGFPTRSPSSSVASLAVTARGVGPRALGAAAARAVYRGAVK